MKRSLNFPRQFVLILNYLEAYQYRGFIFSKLGYENRANADLRKAAQLKLSSTVKNFTYSATEKFSQKYKASNQTKTTEFSYKSQDTNKSKISSPILWQCIRSLNAHKSIIFHIIFTKNGKFFATGGHELKVKLWQLETQEEICTLSGHLDRVSSIAISPDGKTIISGDM